MDIRRFQVNGNQTGKTLQEFLSNVLGISRGKAKSLIDSRQVFVNGRRIWMARHALRAGDRVEAPREAPAPAPPQPPAILYEDQDYLVVNKPPGRLANGPDSVETDLRRMTGLPALQAVHRLDRDTSGCLLMAKRQDAFDRAVELFRDRRILKLYNAIAAGRVAGPEQSISTPIDDERAVTHLQVLDSAPGASHLKLKIETGRTHQIRKHLLHIRHPVVGDRVYNSGRASSSGDRHEDRQMLHAATLQFASPFTGDVIRATAPLPGDFVACLRRHGLKG